MSVEIGIVSGGQAGVDRAALDVALRLGLRCGGWCPAGRGAEDGAISARYPLHETPSPDPAQRTEWNVRDSDATLILSTLPLSGGTGLTLRWAEQLGRPHHTLDPRSAHAREVAEWLRQWDGGRVNVAGPRESEQPGSYAAAYALLLETLSLTRGAGPSAG